MYKFFQSQYYDKSYAEKKKMVSPPSGRLKVIKFKSKVEQDTNAIVDVKSEFWQKQCIQLLDGQHYGYNIIKVEKSKPRNKMPKY